MKIKFKKYTEADLIHSICCFSGQYSKARIFLKENQEFEVLWVGMEHPKRKHKERIEYSKERAERNPHLKAVIGIDSGTLHPDRIEDITVGDIEVLE